VKKSQIISELNNQIEFLQKHIAEMEKRDNLKKKEAYNLLKFKLERGEILEFFGSYLYVTAGDVVIDSNANDSFAKFKLSNDSIIIIKGLFYD